MTTAAPPPAPAPPGSARPKTPVVGRPVRIGELLTESLAAARSSPVPTAVIALIVFGMCLTTLLTAGRAAASRQQILDRIQQAGSLQLTVADTTNSGLINQHTLALVSDMSTVHAATGASLPYDGVNPLIGAGGNTAPVWIISGPVTAIAHLTAGRAPRPGEAIASTAALTALGLDAPAGAVVDSAALQGVGTPNPVPIVGTFTPVPPYDSSDYANGILIAAAPDSPIQRLNVTITDAASAAETQDLVLSVIASPDPSSIQITSPTALADLQATVGGDLTRSGRSLLLTALASGVLLIAIVVLADVLLRRTDLGRRRALGAPRSAVVTLVIARTTAPAIIGAVVGSLAGAWLASRVGPLPPTSTIISAGVLAVIAAALAAVLPAAYAALKDPVHILRTP